MQPADSFAKFIDDSLIRVRLLSEQTHFSFEGIGVAFNGKKEFFQAIAIPQISRWTVQLQNISGNTYWQVSQVYPVEKNLIFKSNEPLVVLGQNLSTDRNFWPGIVSLVKSEKGKFNLISRLPLKNYLAGVLNGEMPKDWPLSTLKAQAIAARSYAQSIMNERKKFSYDVETDHRDQVYIPNVTPDLGAPLTNQQRAIFETRNIILVEKNRLLKAYFHSDCGGESASAKSVWGVSRPSLVLPGKCSSEKKSEWVYKIEEDQLLKKLKSVLPRLNGSIFSAFQWIYSPKSERLSEVKIAFAQGKPAQLSSQDFRKALGYNNLKSTLFNVQKQDHFYIFNGRGFGHGVGLCQWGARSMGKAGSSFQNILAHYYPGAELSNEASIMR